jgi:hypothetical protein
LSFRACRCLCKSMSCPVRLGGSRIRYALPSVLRLTGFYSRRRCPG